MVRIVVCGFFLIIFFGGCIWNDKKASNSLTPNIIFIVADDMGPWTLSINNDPNSHTPELDKIAKSGAVFSNCFASGAVCSPTRASLITGRYPSETGVTNYIPEGDSSGVDLSLKMFPEFLQEEGYSTIMVGKWHLGEHNPEFLPTQRGYDRFTGFPRGGLQSMSPRIQVEGEWQVAEGAYTPDLLTDYAINYVEEFNPFKTGKPFLLSLHFWAPHANTDFPEGMAPTYEGRSWLPMQEVDLEKWKDREIILPEPDFPNLDIPLTIRMTREYYSSVHSVDRNVGRVMKLLDELNLTDNTIVIFTSDHGYMMGHNGLWHKGNGRWLTKDGLDPTGVYGNSRPNLFDTQVERFGVEILTPHEINYIGPCHEEGSFEMCENKEIRTKEGLSITCRALLVATGSEYRQLRSVPGLDSLVSISVHYCATCDGAFYKQKDLFVVGGGNSAFEEGLFLKEKFAKKVTILVKGEAANASSLLQTKVVDTEGIEVWFNHEIIEAKGEDKLDMVKVRNNLTQKITEHHPDGIFIFIGLQPNTKFLPVSMERDGKGFIITQAGFQTSIRGIFAAGDCRLGSVKQAVSAAGEGAGSAIQIREFLN